MVAIRQDDIARFRDAQAQRVARGTANLMLKITRIIFKTAEADGVIVRNEARHVKLLKPENYLDIDPPNRLRLNQPDHSKL